MAIPQEVQSLYEADRLSVRFRPLFCNDSLAFAIRAMLRSASLAHSEVVAGDRLPVPVREKSGSGL